MVVLLVPILLLFPPPYIQNIPVTAVSLKSASVKISGTHWKCIENFSAIYFTLFR